MLKKFKRFLCIPLLVLFALTMLTLPAAAKGGAFYPDKSRAANITFTFYFIKSPSNQPGPPESSNILFGPVQVTTNDKGIYEFPAGLANSIGNGGYIYLETNSPSKLAGTSNDVPSKMIMYDMGVAVIVKAP